MLQLDKVIFVPAYMPPHKDVAFDVTAADRLNMVRLALEGDSRFEISTFEIDKADTSYSIETVKYMRSKYEGAEIFFLTGADCAYTLSEWKNVDELLSLVNFIIARRPGFDKTGPFSGKVEHITIPEVDISSSDIRDRILSKKPIDHLVPDKVAQYIRNKGLYRE